VNCLCLQLIDKKIQQSWQTSALYSYTFTSSPFSIHVRHILPTSKFQHGYSCILLIFYISEHHVWELWVWIQFTGLTLPLWGTPVNNPITLISPVHWGLHFFAADSLCVALNFRTVFPESQNANPLDAEPEPDFNAKSPFKVIRFGVNEEPLRSYIYNYNNCGLGCEGSEDIASERSENRHLLRPRSSLTPLSSKPPRLST